MKTRTVRILIAVCFVSAFWQEADLHAASFYWDADGDDTTAVGGNGVWNTASALWRASSATGALSTWPNTSPNSDQAVLSGTTGTLTIASDTTIYVNDLRLALSGRFVIADGNANSLLVFSGANPQVSQSASTTAINFRNRVEVGTAGLTMEQTGVSSGAYTFDGTNQIVGSGPIRMNMGSSQYGAQLDINAPQENFSGGFQVAKATRRNVTLHAMVTNALGTGAARAEGYGTIALNVWGAQMPVGGVPAGIFAVSNATIRLPSTAASGTPDRFVVGPNAALAGNSVALPSVTRVASFSTSPSSPEVILSPDAVILHQTANSSVSVSGLGTAADLLFGLDANFTATGFSLTVGKGTPWRGLSNTTINDTGTGGREIRLEAGMISIAAGTESITLQGFGVDYNYNPCALILGNGTKTPTFAAVGDPCIARIVRNVKIDTSVPDFPGLAQFWLARGAQLLLLRAGAAATKPAALENGSRITFVPAAAGSSATLGAVTVMGQADLSVTRKTAGTPDTLTAASLIRANQGVLRILNYTGGQLGADERIQITDTNGLMRGNIVDPWIHGSSEFLTYGANGFAVYPSYVTSLALLGDGVVFKGSGTLSSHATLDSMIMSDTIGGSFKLTAGVLPDSSRADRVGLIGTKDNISLSPAFDAGNAEIIVNYPQGSTRTLTLTGAVFANGLTKIGTGILVLNNATNRIEGSVVVWQGTLRVANNGNGLEPGATVYVQRGATYDISAPLGNEETNAIVEGLGTINIAAGKTLVVTNRLGCGDDRDTLDITGTGTLRLSDSAAAVFELDYETEAPFEPRLRAKAAAVNISVSPKVRIETVRNVPPGDFEKTFTLVEFGSRTGTFDSTVECPPGIKGTLSYDDIEKTVRVTLTRSKAKGTVLFVR